ncbi:tetratricopeptide repeat protein [Kingella negevensis]|uniref:tetratricopeptide repeat protein n=1 Tax=Kingella negevensis TaxID=1522312 RepID=UPI00050A0A98|nr:tetratricopeptide repeat protein [Kingella negevensis]MDK4689114.1 tetratricopeptide repeat protein [Kingella negevensis]WII90697.1 tetratricopeptide repeat protein [Kingella negevensis]
MKSERTQHQELARELIETCQLAQAEPLVRALYQDTQNTFGEDSLEHAQSLVNLGNWHEGKGDFGASETLLKQAVQTIRRHNETRKHNAQLADALHQLGGTYCQQGKLAEAQAVYQEAQTLYTQPENAAQIALLLNDLGSTYSEQPEKALEYYEQSAALHEKLFGMEYRYTALTYTNAAAIYRRQGHLAEAQSILEHTTQIQQRCSGDHILTAVALSELAATYDEQGNHQQAETLYNQAADMITRVFGKEHVNYGRILARLAYHHYLLNDFDTTLNMLHQSLEIFIETFDEDHAAVRNTIQNIVTVMMASGKEEFKMKRSRKK